MINITKTDATDDLDLLTPGEAAALLRTTPGQLNQYRFHRTGPDFFKNGRKILYRRRDLIAYVNRSIIDATDPHR